MSGMISIEDLKRFDVWAVERGYSDPSRYMAACEAFEAQQVIIDELRNNLSQPEQVTLDTSLDELNAVVPLQGWEPSAVSKTVLDAQVKKNEEVKTRLDNMAGKRPPGNYHKKRGANGRFA